MSETTTSLIAPYSDGGPVAGAINGVTALLQAQFLPTRFRYKTVQPRMSVERWRELANVAPMVGIALASWNPSRESYGLFRGDVMLAVFLLVKQQKPEDLQAGTKTMPGVSLMMNAAVQALHGQRLAGLGTVMVRGSSNQEAAGWIDDRTAIVTLSVAVTNVGYDQASLAAALDDFNEISGTWQFGTASTPDDNPIGDTEA
ncbi:hypothetical protein AA12717_0395 [Gluconacetobacter sacchari DSM 12717]|uniref:Uncharacterized protein n=2 Tax=Gluconacetobacter sacchari TaxID=92759 RepID=A0A7W4IC18_9PROT|nr:hypothetical protein [Gluconacetobacter sacchari]MBB2160088.1 hypothetical protein [Gluconacetobacter sacchari]GBQ19920.1 hypothetical protein AA12717_0395 [Gluconacetobacter sacchari DSM 12717]